MTRDGRSPARRWACSACVATAARRWAYGLCVATAVAAGCRTDVPQVPAASATAAAMVVDAFDDPAPWTAHPADGVSLALSSDRGRTGRSLRLDFDFHGGGGYAVARRAVALELPDNYAFAFQVRGTPVANHLEFKLVDATGDNVWWHVERDVQFVKSWRPIVIPKRKIRFAWGPLGGGELRRVAAIEFAITAGAGGKGSVWIDELELRPLQVESAAPPPIRASAEAAAGSDAAFAVDADTATAWVSPPGSRGPQLVLDLGTVREFGGLVLQWEPGRHAAGYEIETSADGQRWQSLRWVSGSNGGRDALYLPESQARAVRLRVRERAPGAKSVALREVELRPLEWSATRAAFLEAEARLAPRGTFPRGLSGEQVYWTVVGGAHDGDDFLLSEDGALEIGLEGFTLEPFLFESGRLRTWADVQTTQQLADGHLPVPSVRWADGDLGLLITALADAASDSSRAVSYEVANEGDAEHNGSLFVAIRPFQVNPPAQFLNVTGGAARVRSILWDPPRAFVFGDRALHAAPAPAGFGAVTWAGGDLVADFLRAGALPVETQVRDEDEAASGAFRFDWRLGPGESRTFTIDIERLPSGPPSRATFKQLDRRHATRRVPINAEAARAGWATRLDRATITVPDTVVMQTLSAQLGWIYVNRAGDAIQPGTRSYRRSWIRDGALTSSALLRTGHGDAARAFLEWFSPHQYSNGKIPCVVDWRGADPTPEHDSNGEFVFLVAECLRIDGDLMSTRGLWPRVQAAVAYLDSLRGLRRTAEFQGTEFYGLLPPSISHEGYSAKPMHSYWDDLWAWRGFGDAAFVAGALGHDAERDRIAALQKDFGGDLRASVEAAMRRHAIDYVPGCADLGDFDATSTTIALSPAQAGAVLPPAAVQRTFEKYWENFVARRGGAAWDGFTPYEIRNVGAFVRLGWRDRAHELLTWFLDQQRPPGWRQWPEVVYKDPRAPRFLGDLPHTWVGSDYVRSVLEMLAYEDDAAQSLVLAHGVPARWLEGDGITVRDLPTAFGPLSYTARREAAGVVMTIESGLRIPPGGIDVRMPPPYKPTWAFFGVTETLSHDQMNQRPPARSVVDSAYIVRELPVRIIWTD